MPRLSQSDWSLTLRDIGLSYRSGGHASSGLWSPSSHQSPHSACSTISRSLHQQARPCGVLARVLDDPPLPRLGVEQPNAVIAALELRDVLARERVPVVLPAQHSDHGTVGAAQDKTMPQASPNAWIERREPRRPPASAGEARRERRHVRKPVAQVLDVGFVKHGPSRPLDPIALCQSEPLHLDPQLVRAERRARCSDILEIPAAGSGWLGLLLC